MKRFLDRYWMPILSVLYLAALVYALHAVPACAQDSGYFAQQTYTSTGGATYTLPYPYISQGDISVTDNGVTYAGTMTFTSASVISLSPVIASGHTVVIHRHTKVTAALRTFNGGTLSSTDLNTNELQTLYLHQEEQDGVYGASTQAQAAAVSALAAATSATAASSSSSSSTSSATSAAASSTSASSSAATAQTLANTVESYGADPTGTNDSSAAFNLCLASTTPCRALAKYKISSNVTLAAGASLDCGQLNPGPGFNAFTGWTSRPAIRLASTATISGAGSGGISHCVIYRSGMSLPSNDNSAFAGTALTLGSGGSKGDFKVNDVMVLGFDTCLTSTNNDRIVIEDFYGDCNAGVAVVNSADSAHLDHIHIWPYATIGGNGGAPTDADLQRTGVGIDIVGFNADTYVGDSLVYGHSIGMYLHNTGDVTIGKLWIDDTPTDHSSTGVWVDGTSDNIYFQTLWIWSTTVGLQVSNSSSLGRVHVGQLYVNGTKGACVTAAEGQLYVSDGSLAFCGSWAMTIANAASVYGKFDIFGLGAATGSCPISLDTNLSSLNVRLTVTYDNTGGNCLYATNSLLLPTTASASSITVPFNADAVEITGTTNIGTILPGWSGRTLLLKFDAALTVVNTGNLALAGGASFTTAANSLIQFVYVASLGKWVEQWRKA